jgi:hypothetical protein
VKEPDLLFEQLRATAVAHPQPCGYCHANPGELCKNKKTGEPLVNAPAHYARLQAAPLPKTESSQ